MFRHLGRFAPLALCLFAIVIVMGSCGTDDPPPPPIEVEPTPVEPTPMEKLTGTWLKTQEVYGEHIFSMSEEGLTIREILKPNGNGWTYTVNGVTKSSGPKWSANATTITYTWPDGSSNSMEYTFIGRILILTSNKVTTPAVGGEPFRTKHYYRKLD